ncbi:MAG TPA: CxxxxCH/CxxCH domain-containing protein [Anaeromyxobacteraceae bacterium]|nr:CxxxxCH/CxxCH domain-containing protein [Anaeromyxobacteraceae bacterium]
MRDPRPNEGARDAGGRPRGCVLLAILCGPLLLVAACGEGGAAGGPADGVVAQAATTCTPGGGHATYGTSCESCHPCGTRATGGHAASWTDPASAGFHAYSANQGLAACQGCHGVNLDGVGGAARTACAQCHGAAWRTTCTMCHGGTDSATGAPPKATWGNAADAVRVGAHSSHVGAVHGLSAPVACAACHVTPADALAAGHVGGGTATVTWSGLATSGGAAPAWNRAAGTCGSTYCHGATLGAGGTNHDPVWTTVNGTQAACGTCHGIPPPAPHTTSTACGGCHTGYSSTAVNAAVHVDGKLDVADLGCTSCHGNGAQTATAASPLYAAPPVDASGASTGIRVGAHQKHLLGGSYANGIGCQGCHAGVATYTTGHQDGVRQVGFTGAANANLRKGTWRPGTGTAAGSCSATWCHGAVINRNGGTSGGTATVPTWTGSIAACTSCHAVLIGSLPNRHTESHHRVACSTCHGPGYTATGTGSSLTGNGVNRATHVDGVKTVVTVSSGTGIRSWNPTTRSCTPSCHGSETW